MVSTNDNIRFATLTLIFPWLTTHTLPHNIHSKSTLSTLTINFQNVVAKHPYLHCLLNERQPDVIFRCETWLSPSIQTSEIFPTSYHVFRHDRNDGYGGVLLAVHNALTCKVYQL